MIANDRKLCADTVSRILSFRDDLIARDLHKAHMKSVLFGTLRTGEERVYQNGVNRPMRRESYYWVGIDYNEYFLGEDVSVVFAVEVANKSICRMASLLGVPLPVKVDVARLYQLRHGLLE